MVIMYQADTSEIYLQQYIHTKVLYCMLNSPNIEPFGSRHWVLAWNKAVSFVKVQHLWPFHQLVEDCLSLGSRWSDIQLDTYSSTALFSTDAEKRCTGFSYLPERQLQSLPAQTSTRMLYTHRVESHLPVGLSWDTSPGYKSYSLHSERHSPLWKSQETVQF